jgi:hypothetical protein
MRPLEQLDPRPIETVLPDIEFWENVRQPKFVTGAEAGAEFAGLAVHLLRT